MSSPTVQEQLAKHAENVRIREMCEVLDLLREHDLFFRNVEPTMWELSAIKAAVLTGTLDEIPEFVEPKSVQSRRYERSGWNTTTNDDCDAEIEAWRERKPRHGQTNHEVYY